MKILNEYVDITIGRKKYHLKNMIMPEYLKRLAYKTAYGYTDYYTQSVAMNYVFIKFDKILPLEAELRDDYTPADFDIILQFDHIIENMNIEEQKIVKDIEWGYWLNNDSGSQGIPTRIWDLKEKTSKKISNYKGRKITNVGFGSSMNTNVPILSILEVSRQNMKFDNDYIAIKRRDEILLDGYLLNFDSKIKGGEHLFDHPTFVSGDIENQKENSWVANIAKPTNVGFTYNLNSVKYYRESELTAITQQSNNEVKFLWDNRWQEYKNTKQLYPSIRLYPSNKEKKYPTKSQYMYLFIEYEVQNVICKDGNLTYGDILGHYYMLYDIVKEIGKGSQFKYLTIEYD